VYFNTKEHARLGIVPALVHNNYLIGREKKISRFKENKLWFLAGKGEGVPLSILRRLLCGAGNKGGSNYGYRGAPHEQIGRKQLWRLSRLRTFLHGRLAVRDLTGHHPYRNYSPHYHEHHDTDDDSSNIFFEHPCGPSSKERYLIIIVSLGTRPWVRTLTLPRLRDYAARTFSDLLLLRHLSFCHSGIDPTPSESRNEEAHDMTGCAKRAKLIVAAAALSGGDIVDEKGRRNKWRSGAFDRVIVVDDTMLFRRDSPNLFDLVPPGVLGASVEGKGIRSERARTAMMRMSLLRYAQQGWHAMASSAHGRVSFVNEGAISTEELLMRCCHDIEALASTGAVALELDMGDARNKHGSNNNEARADARWFNSGLLVLSSHHIQILEFNEVEAEAVDFMLLWDQGLLNARRRVLGVPLLDLGYRFNWVGSFNHSNDVQRPFNAAEAFAVHATTGLPRGSDGTVLEARMAFLKEIHSIWVGRGV
jgi:hypothetical protein